MGLLDFIGNILEKVENHKYDIGYKHGCEPNAYKRHHYCSNHDSEYYIKGFDDGYYDTNKARYALSCRKCGGDAFPVKATDRHYNCGCGHKFTGSKHPF